MHNSSPAVKDYTALAHRAYLVGILRAEWWGWRCGRRRRRAAAAAAGWVPAGTSLRRRARGLAWAGGALPTRALSAGGGRQDTVRGSGASGVEGSPPPPPGAAPREDVGGPSPALARQPPASPRGWEWGAGRGADSCRLPLPHHTKGSEHRAGTTEPPVCSPREEPGEGKRRTPGGVTTTSGAASPSVHFPVRTFSFWDVETGEKQAGSFYARYRPDLRGVLPAQLALCSVSGPNHRRRGGGSAAQPPPPDPLGAASRVPRQRGGCAAAPAPAHGSRSPATLSPAPCLSFAFPAPLAFEPPPAPGMISACQLIPFSPDGFVPSRAPARRFPARRGAP